jgi:hypothetical protein
MIQYVDKKRGKYRSIDDDTPPDAPDVMTLDEFLELFDNAGTVSLWDFNCALGTTCREKYESLWMKLLELAGVISQKIGKQMTYWAAVHPCVGTACFQGFSHSPRLIPMGGTEPIYLGTLCQRMEIFECPLPDPTRILVGCGNEKMTPEHYARLSLCNYVI